MNGIGLPERRHLFIEAETLRPRNRTLMLASTVSSTVARRSQFTRNSPTTLGMAVNWALVLY